MKTIADLEAAILAHRAGGVALHFGPSVVKGRENQWFANTGPLSHQVYGDTLQEALCALLTPGRSEDDIFGDLM